MVAKIKTNDHGDCIFSEQDAIDLLYANPDFDISKLFFEDIDQFNSSLQDLGLDFGKLKTAPKRSNINDFDKQNFEDWHMPEKYYKINVWIIQNKIIRS